MAFYNIFNLYINILLLLFYGSAGYFYARSLIPTNFALKLQPPILQHYGVAWASVRGQQLKGEAEKSPSYTFYFFVLKQCLTLHHKKLQMLISACQTTVEDTKI